MSIQENNDYYVKQANLIATMFTAGIIDNEEYLQYMAQINDNCYSDRD